MACNRISSIIELLNSLLLPPKRASHSSKVCMVSETHENLAARVGEFSIWIRTQFDMSLLKYSIYFVQFDLMKVSTFQLFIIFAYINFCQYIYLPHDYFWQNIMKSNIWYLLYFWEGCLKDEWKFNIKAYLRKCTCP